jgi:hypothetical protein
MTRYSLYTKLGGSPGTVWRVQEISPPLGFDAQTVHPASIIKIIIIIIIIIARTVVSTPIFPVV